MLYMYNNKNSNDLICWSFYFVIYKDYTLDCFLYLEINWEL
jgi:hypothetical protein